MTSIDLSGASMNIEFDGVSIDFDKNRIEWKVNILKENISLLLDVIKHCFKIKYESEPYIITYGIYAIDFKVRKDD